MPSKQTIIDRLQKIQDNCQEVVTKFEEKHHDLVSWMATNSLSIDDLRHSSQQILAAVSLAGAVSLNHPTNVFKPHEVEAQEEPSQPEDILSIKVSAEEHDEVLNKLQSVVQMPPGHLEKETELYLEQQLSDVLGFEVTAELDGHRLNHSIGIMGGEQHLKRFAGDTLDQHDGVQEAGMAPNRGAFGWFTENGQLTDKAIQREKYYFAVQTLYLPNWSTEYPSLKEWYKFRKMIVINPAEKVAVVGVVGDAGPAAWVQKQFGGSPEVIREGKIWSPKTRGHVLLLFVDDPDDTIPLGPISLEHHE